MTKVIDLTVPQGGEAKKKKIEFVGCLIKDCDSFNFGKNPGEILQVDFLEPKTYKNINRVASSEMGYAHDVFQCINKEGRVVIMLGHFNDGVV